MLFLFYTSKVSDLYDNGKSISWDEALVTVQAKDFRQRASLDKHDPMVYLLEGIHDKFMSKVPEPRQSSGFIQQVYLIYIYNILLSYI